MKLSVLSLAVMIMLAGCATVAPVSPEVKEKVERMPVDELPIYASIEQQRCPKAKFTSSVEKMECKYEVRRELAARDLMKKQAEK